MDILPSALSPSSRLRSPGSLFGCTTSPARRKKGSPASCGSPLRIDSLQSPVKIDSPEVPISQRLLFPDSPVLVESTMRVTQVPQTAPAGDRRSKRFDLSHWQREIDNIAAPSTVAPTSKASLFPTIASFPAKLDLAVEPVAQRRYSLSTAKLDEDEDEDSPFRVPSTSARRANSLKQHRVSPEVSLVPTSASHGALSAVTPNAELSGRLSSSTSGAQLESLNETDAQSSFAPREPVLEPTIFSPVASTSSATGPTRSRAGSVSRIPVRTSSDSLARARKATSMMDLAAKALNDPLASSRKRNANGALVGNGGARSRLAAVSPIGPPSSSGIMPSSSPSAHAMRDMVQDSDDDEEETTIPRSRSQALPLHMRLSEPLPQLHRLDTPAACKIARPLQSAFKTSGLMSKRVRASEPLPLRGLPFAIKTDAKEMPDTPVKRPTLLEVASQSGIPRPLLRTNSSSSSGSMTETSPTALKAAALSSRFLPLMRRRSSGSLRDEPQTPTRVGQDSPISSHQLAATPTERISPDGKAWPPAPTIVTTTGRQSPLTPFNPRASHPPPPASRPAFRARHSNSALLTLRQRELSTPDRFESQFVVVRELGKGESSEAFAVQDRQQGTVWAVKRTKLAYGGPKDRTRKLEEVDALRTLSGHPHIVLFADAWEQGGHLFIQTELCDGGSLAYFLDLYGQQHERLPESCVWKLLAEVSAGLAHIHGAGFLHLDLKPANIFLTADGTCRIGDFGMATRWPRQSALEIVRNAGIDHPGWDTSIWENQPTVLERRYRMRSAPEPASLAGLELEREGDREYIAPEVLSGLYGHEADVFSFGLIILEAATNVVLPDNGEPWRKLRAGDVSDVELSPLSDQLVMLLMSLLQPVPEHRLTAAQLACHHLVHAVRTLTSGHSTIVPEPAGFLEYVLGESAEPDDAMDVDSPL